MKQLLAGLLALVCSASAAMIPGGLCETASLAEYISLGSGGCRLAIGNVRLSDWSYTQTGTVPAEEVTVGLFKNFEGLGILLISAPWIVETGASLSIDIAWRSDHPNLQYLEENVGISSGSGRITSIVSNVQPYQATLTVLDYTHPLITQGTGGGTGKTRMLPATTNFGNASASLVAGAGGRASIADVEIDYRYNPPPSDVPEPVNLSMCACGLSILAIRRHWKQ